jgi:hypothetical protein
MSLPSSPGLFDIFITAVRPAFAQRWQTARAASFFDTGQIHSQHFSTSCSEGLS